METKFNFKSAICTSIVQSRRLLELGLKKETADCYWFYCDIAKEWKCTILSSTQVFKDYPTKVIPAWSPLRLVEMMPPSIKDGYHYSLVYDIHRDAIEYICFANGGLQRPYNRLLWDTQSTDPFDNIICCIEWLIKEGCFNKEYLEK